MISSKDIRWIQLARKVAAKSKHKKYCIGSVIIKAGAVVSIGINKEAAPKPFIKQYRSNLAHHSEIDSLVGLDREVTKGCTIYVAGFTTAAKKDILSKPCLTCTWFCKEMGIKRIVYMTKEGKISEISG